MCVLVEPATSQHCRVAGMEWVQLRIRGVGKIGVTPLVPPDSPGIVDARRIFGNDDSLAALRPEIVHDELLRLHEAAKEIERKLGALRADAPVGHAVSLIVQCEKGQSRSVRCVGAYLIRTLGFSAAEAYDFLVIRFNSPRVDNCNPQSKISKGNVPQWLYEYAKNHRSYPA